MTDLSHPPGAAPKGQRAAAAAYRARHGEAPAQEALPWNPVLETILSHRSVRAFLPDPVAEPLLEALVAAAASAPTSSNLQAWSVVAVTDPARKDRLAAWAGDQAHVRSAPLVLVWVADLSRAVRVASARGTLLEGLAFTETLLLATIDAALAAQNAVVAAESLGLGTVYLGALRNHPLEVAAELGLPPRSYAVFGLVIGYPDPAVPTEVKPRLPQAAVLHRERYDPEDAAAIRRLDRSTAAFRERQNLSPEGWSELVVARLATVAALKGRDGLRQALERLGFPQR